jgi:hypothetical protein
MVEVTGIDRHTLIQVSLFEVWLGDVGIEFSLEGLFFSMSPKHLPHVGDVLIIPTKALVREFEGILPATVLNPL